MVLDRVHTHKPKEAEESVDPNDYAELSQLGVYFELRPKLGLRCRFFVSTLGGFRQFAAGDPSTDVHFHHFHSFDWSPRLVGLVGLSRPKQG